VGPDEKPASVAVAPVKAQKAHNPFAKEKVSLFASAAIAAAPPMEAKSLTQDHTCIAISEKQRIEKAGGRVENGARLNACIA
jgi:hypothetical protein